MNIITITLNPAFDIHCYVEIFLPFHENLGAITDRDAGGKGINISKALSANNIKNTALLVLGEEDAESFQRDLSKYSVPIKSILLPGRIRENITIHEKDSRETRLSFQGFSADNSLLDQVFEVISANLSKGDIVTFTGRIPDGIEMASVLSFLERLTEKGAKIVIDSRSFELEDIVHAKPWLIKPNQEEISHYFERPIQSVEEAVDCAKDLLKLGISNVMISLGEMGAVLACKEGTFLAKAPKIDAISTIGAGDSAIAGFLSASVSGGTPQDQLASAIAFGSAACLQRGTIPPGKDDVDRLIRAVQVVEFN